MEQQADEDAIAAVVRTFFAAFTSDPDLAARVADLRALFLPGAVIVRTCGLAPVVYDVDGFLAPRQELLAGGDLVGFHEWELAGRTEVFGDIALHLCSYAKEWVQEGTALGGRGMKTLHLIRTADGWRISAVAWDDERPGLRVPDAIGESGPR